MREKNVKNIFGTIYSFIVPSWIRNKRNELISKNELRILKKRIIKYYTKLSKSTITQEQRTVIQYLKDNPITCYPYYFQKYYNSNRIKVFKDYNNSRLFTIYNNQKLYFKKNWDSEKIRNYFNDLLIEQDLSSPHRYLTDEFNINNDDVVIDVGAAEGIFSLSIIEKASKVYLFESDEEWVDALNITFSPWKEKVIITQRFVSNRNDDFNITLDSFFQRIEKIDFLKIDVDGSESELLQGSENLIMNSNSLRIALCTYHRQNDENLFAEYLKSKRFDISYSNGFMIFYHDNALDAPYLRRGLIRATRAVI